MKMKKWMIIAMVACMLVCSGCSNTMKEGMQQLQNQQYGEAAKSFEKVIKEGKNLAEAYHAQGIAYWETKEYEKCKEALEKALENGAKGTPNLYQTLGDVCMELKVYEEALAYYWKGMASEGLTEEQLQNMLYNEIMAYEGLKDWDGAKVKMAAYIAKYPEDTDAQKEAEFLETR